MQKMYEVLDKLPQEIKLVISKISKENLAELEEICLRVNSPLCVSAYSRVYFVLEDGSLSSFPTDESLIITKQQIKECFKKCCNYSIHSYEREIRNGYITINGGHRVGICGEAIYDGDRLRTIDNISSLNIRIAREIGCGAKALFDLMPIYSVGGFIIAGRAKTGKTTLLRSVAKYLSSGENGFFKKLAIVDERCELTAMYQGEPQVKIGECCDVLSGFKKSDGISIAIRTLSPDYIVCDEISLDEEIEAVYRGVNSGANIITTVHAKNLDEFISKPFAKKLIQTNAFSAVVFLDVEEKGRLKEVIYMDRLMPLFSKEEK